MPSIELPPEKWSPRRARVFSDELLRARGVGAALIEDTRLVVSELVANAVTHAGTRVIVEMDVDADAVHVAVRDFSPDRPRQRPIGPASTADRGLHIVDLLTDHWSVRRLDDGKVVEARLPFANGSR